MFRILRGFMAKHGLDVADLAKVMGISRTSASNKLNEHVDFSLVEARKVVDFFNERGEKLTVDSLFFDSVSTIGD
jgi:DNA-binding XRE family transcriptional regulator